MSAVAILSNFGLNAMILGRPWLVGITLKGNNFFGLSEFLIEETPFDDLMDWRLNSFNLLSGVPQMAYLPHGVKQEVQFKGYCECNWVSEDVLVTNVVNNSPRNASMM